jgi:hypothetical protein
MAANFHGHGWRDGDEAYATRVFADCGGQLPANSDSLRNLILAAEVVRLSGNGPYIASVAAPGKAGRPTRTKLPNVIDTSFPASAPTGDGERSLNHVWSQLFTDGPNSTRGRIAKGKSQTQE